MTFRNTSDTPAASKLVHFEVDDGDTASGYTARVIKVTAVDDAPAVSTSAAALAYRRGDPAVAADPGLTVDDVDDAELEGASVSVAGAGAGDALGFTAQNGIARAVAGGTLTLNGTATVAQYETALRSVTFATASADTPRTLTFTVTDGDASSVDAARTVTVTTAAAASPTPTGSATPTATVTATPTATPTSSATPADSSTATPAGSPTPTPGSGTTTPAATPTTAPTPTPTPKAEQTTLTGVSVRKRVKRGRVQIVRFTLNRGAKVTLTFAHKGKRRAVTRTYTAAGRYTVRVKKSFAKGKWRMKLTAPDAKAVTRRFPVKR